MCGHMSTGLLRLCIGRQVQASGISAHLVHGKSAKPDNLISSLYCTIKSNSVLTKRASAKI